MVASSVAEENVCPICHEEFEQFYKQEFDESIPKGKPIAGAEDSDDGQWHLVNAIRPGEDEEGVIPGRAYHPQCFKDRQNSSTLEESGIANESRDAETTSMPTDSFNLDQADDAPSAEDVTETEVKTEAEVEPEEEAKEIQKTEKEVKEEPMEEEVEVKKEIVDEVTTETEPASNVESTEGSGEAADENAEVKKEPSVEKDEMEMNTSLDEMNLTSGDSLAPTFVLPQPGGIKVNIALPTPAFERQESTRSTSESEDAPDTQSETKSEFDPEAIIQEVENTEDKKPKMKGRNFVEMPPQMKDKELSSLCVIM